MLRTFSCIWHYYIKMVIYSIMAYCTKIFLKSLRTLLPLCRNYLPEIREKLRTSHCNIHRIEDLISVDMCVKQVLEKLLYKLSHMCDVYKEKINVCKDLVGPPEGMRQLVGLGVYWRMILRWILEKQGGCLA
jgi:hypothetical protein